MDAESRLSVILSIDSIKFPLTGIGRYTYELVTHIGRSDAINSLRLFSGTQFVDSLPSVNERLSAGSKSLKHLVLNSGVATSLYSVSAGWLKKRALSGSENCIFHGPNYYLPNFGGKCIATFHDLSMYQSQFHPRGRIRYMKREIEQSLKRASMLITDSEFTRQEIAEYFSWPLNKIRAISLAGSCEFYPRSNDEVAAVLNRFGLKPGAYTLFSGTIEPRKNLDSLLSAYGSLPISVRQRWPLVLCGYKGWLSEALHTRIERAQREGWVKYLGYLPAEELPILFAGARLFAFPSLYEGFGLPILEAMASGVPVVCSNAASLPEVAGEAAGMCSPLDIDGLTDLISRGLEDSEWRTVAMNAGLARAKEFSWLRCAQETISVYKELQFADS